MPKVSVIIPVYGVEKYIHRCAQSLFEQTLDDIEYLFIDDCTPDNSVKVLNEVLDDYPHRRNQVIIHRMEQNSGQAVVRTWGLQNATGDYVINCDSDDWVEASLYEKMYSKAIKNSLDIIACDIEITTGEDIVHRISGGDSSDIDACINQMLYQKMKWSLCNKLIKRTLFNNIVYPKGAMGEDLCITLQVMLRARSINYVNGRYFYFTNPLSIVNTHSETRVVEKFNQISDNIDIVVDVYTKNNSTKYKKGLNYLNFVKHDILVPIVGNTFYLNIWKKGVKKFALPILLDSDVIFKDRIKALLILLGLYPFSSRLLRALKK